MTEGDAAGGAAVTLAEPIRTNLTNGNVLASARVSGSAGDGLSAESARHELERVEDNAFVGNAGFGLSLGAGLTPSLDAASLYDSPMAPNGRRGIALEASRSIGGTDLSSGEAVLRGDLGVPWHLEGLRVGSGARLVVEPGAELLPAPDGTFGVGATVTLRGTADRPICTSGAGDDPTDWAGMRLSEGVELAHVELVGGGADALDGAPRARSS